LKNNLILFDVTGTEDR